MRHTVRRRLLGVAASATAVAAIATPAYAAAPKIKIVLPAATVAAGGSTYVVPVFFADRETTLAHPKVTFQLAGGLPGVSLKTVDPIFGCTQPSPTTVTCAPTFGLKVGPDGTFGNFPVGLAATKAALGETGKLTVTLAADGIAPVKATVDANVAEGVDLAAGGDTKISVTPGDDFSTVLQVHNTSGSVVHGAAVYFATDNAYASTQQFANCLYTDGQVNACSFDQDLQPGATYQVTVPYQLRPDTSPGTVNGFFEWLAGDDWDDLIKFIREGGGRKLGTPGTGGTLSLEPVPASQALRQTDPNPDNNWQEQFVDVSGAPHPDLAAIGATASGAAGAKVTLPVAVWNKGPTDLGSNHTPWAAAALITIPTGATVTSFPNTCELNGEDSVLIGDPGKVQYACFTDAILPAHQTVTWEFGLRIDKATANATGSIAINPDCKCDLYHDGNKANDTAPIVLNPDGAPANPSGTPANPSSAPASPGGGTGGAGGGLPITGPQTALVGAAGAALLAGGAAFFVLSRRRRTRFEA